MICPVCGDTCWTDVLVCPHGHLHDPSGNRMDAEDAVAVFLPPEPLVPLEVVYQPAALTPAKTIALAAAVAAAFEIVVRMVV